MLIAAPSSQDPATAVADPRTRDAARSALALPAFGLGPVAASVGMSHRQMVMTLQRGLDVRGRCAGRCRCHASVAAPSRWRCDRCGGVTAGASQRCCYGSVTVPATLPRDQRLGRPRLDLHRRRAERGAAAGVGGLSVARRQSQQTLRGRRAQQRAVFDARTARC